MIWDFQRILSLRLLSWGGLSILAGAAWLLGTEPTWRGFGLQALAWGAIDALIAAFGLRGLESKLTAPLDLAEAARRAGWLRHVLMVNAGLDVLYILGGAWLSANPDPYNAGMGWGILVQGAFLLLFDSLHAWQVPAEIFVPDWHLFEGPEHLPVQLAGGKPGVVIVHGFPDTPVAVRDLVELFQRRGWTVSAPLLPGFGPQITSLYQRRAAEWIDAVADEVLRLKRDHQPVLLVGFSMGGGCAIPAAVRTQPNGVALLAPFWWHETLPLKLLVWALRLLGPAVLRVGRWVSPNSPELRSGAAAIAPQLSFDDPRVQAELRGLRVPLAFLEQFRRHGQAVCAAAPLWQGPTLILQGAADTLARPANTRALARLLGRPPRLHIIPGDHNLNLASHPSWERAAAELTAFADEIANQK